MRRRRTRGTWFPTIGTTIGEDFPQDTLSGRTFQVTIVSPAIQTIITSLTFDTPQEGDNLIPATETLSEIIGNEYLLQRIVGKLYGSRLSTISDQGRDINPAILFGAGFFIARANDEAVGGGDQTPIGSASEPERRDNYGVIENDTIREPWIWRRTWILGNAQAGIVNNPALGGTAGSAPATLAEVGNYPTSTALYGSVLDGPHIDSKVKRRVSQENRLWLAISTTTWPLGTAPSQAFPLLLNGYIDYRLFGSLRKAKNNSAF